MPDGKRNRGPADRDRINAHESYQLEYWTKQFDVSAQELKECVQRAGPMVEDAKRDLGR